MGSSRRIFLKRFDLSLAPRWRAIICSSQERFAGQRAQSAGSEAISSSKLVRASLNAFGPLVFTTIPSLMVSVQAVTGFSLPSTSTKHKRHDAAGSGLSRRAHRLGINISLSSATQRRFSPSGAVIFLLSIVNDMVFISTFLRLAPHWEAIASLWRYTGEDRP